MPAVFGHEAVMTGNGPATGDPQIQLVILRRMERFIPSS